MHSEKHWTWFLIIISTTYLVAELIFNHELVTNASTTDQEQLRQLELWGRCIAGTGFSIVVMRLLPFGWIRQKLKLFFGGIIVVACWSIMFFGQKLLIDWYVETADQEQRLNAWHIVLLKQGIDTGAIQLDGLKKSGELGRDKTLISMLGLISYNLPEYIQLLRNRSKEIAVSIAEHNATENIELAYEGFVQLRSELESQYQSGIEGQKFAKSYPPVLQRELKQFFTERRQCEKEPKAYFQGCIEAVDVAYDQKISQAIGKKIEWKKFCRPSFASTTYEVRAGKMTAVQSDFLDCNDVEASRIEKVILLAVGIKFNFETWHQFSRLPKVQRVLKDKLELNLSYIDPDMTKAEFLSLVIKPRFRKQLLKERDRWLSDSISTEDGHRALRAVVVHPIALGFSLFFSMLNAVGLLAALARLKFGKTFSHSLYAVGLVLAVTLPLVIPSADYGMNQFISVIRDDLGMATQWVMTVEPLIYNLFGGD